MDSGYPTPPYPAPQPPRDDPAQRSAVYCWVIGGLTTLLFSCCGCSIGALATMPAGEVQRAFTRQQSQSGGQITQEQIQMLMQLHPTGYAVLAVAVVLLGLIPSVALLLLGFAVRQRKRWAIIAALVIIGVQTLICGGLLFFSLVGGLISGDPVGVLFSLLVFGGVTTLLIFALRSLRRTMSMQQAAPVVRSDGTEPWDETDW